MNQKLATLMRLYTESSIGKQLRLRRIFDDSGLLFAVPMDHGYSLGPVKGLVNLQSTTSKVIAGGANCIIIKRGMLRSVHSKFNRETTFMIHISGSTSLSPWPNKKIPTGSVKNTIFLGADGISCHVNVGTNSDYLMLQDMNSMVTQADRFGLPTLAMMYVRDDEGRDDMSVSSLAHVGRVAEESGIDIVKLNSTATGKDYDEVIQGINIPVIVAGGPSTKDFTSFLEIIRNCIERGAKGVSIGRNVFQSDNPQSAMKKIKETVIAAKKEH